MLVNKNSQKRYFLSIYVESVLKVSQLTAGLESRCGFLALYYSLVVFDFQCHGHFLCKVSCFYYVLMHIFYFLYLFTALNALIKTKILRASHVPYMTNINVDKKGLIKLILAPICHEGSHFRFIKLFSVF